MILALTGRCPPNLFPTRTAALNEIPRGNLANTPMALRVQVKAATYFAPKCPAKSAIISRAHHSAHNWTVPGMDSLRNVFQSRSAQQPHPGHVCFTAFFNGYKQYGHKIENE